MVSIPNTTAAQPVQWTSTTAGSPTASLDDPPMDCESAALFRAHLRPLLEQATTWHGLSELLGRKGYRVMFVDGRMVLNDLQSDRPICTLRFLGTSLRELVARLGRPIVRALPDRPACGELMMESPRNGAGS